jgi:hypothetical protein
VRVFYEDDYAQPMSGIVLERGERGEGRLTLILLRNPPRLGDTRSAPFRRIVRTARVAELTTASIFVRAGGVFTTPVERPESVNPDPTVEPICIHPRGARIEVRVAGRWVVRDRDTCEIDDLLRFALEMGQLAVSHRPECAALDPRVVGNSVMYRLKACGRLDGDLRSAASAMNTANAALGAGWEGDWSRSIEARLSAESRMSWGDGADVVGPAAIGSDLRSRTGDAEYEASIKLVEGLDSTTARAFGQVRYYRGGDAGVPYESGSAAMEVVWVREPDGPWRIATWTIGPFEADEYE